MTVAGAASAEDAGRPRGDARRTVAVLTVSLVLYAATCAAVFYVLAVRGIGYHFFDVSDIPLYHEYALAIARGARPYVDFAPEYPPVALWVFAVAGPRDGLSMYALRFALEMAFLGAASALATAWTATRLWPSGRRAWLVACGFAVATAATGALLGNRFDAAVMLPTAAAVALLVARRPTAAAAVLGIGFALKIVPAVLLPLVLIAAPSRRAALHAALAFAIAAALPFLPYLPGGLGGLAGMFAYHGARPLQVESVLATPLWLAHLLGVVPVGIESSFGSQNVLAPGARALALLSTPVGLAALAVAYGVLWRGRVALRERPALVAVAAAAVLLAFLVAGKVLSPQYLIWLIPLAALACGEQPVLAALLLGAMALTQLEFPANYWAFARGEAGPVACVVARNLTLVAALGVALRAVWRAGARDAPARVRRTRSPAH